MTVIITGAAGFIGSHLSERYLSEGHRVIGVDDFSSSDPDSLHLKRLQANDKFTTIVGSIEEIETLNRVERMHNYLVGGPSLTTSNLILNFACPASPPRYQEIPLKTMDTCYLGTKNVLFLARRLNARVVHASTSEVYGDPIKSPQVETDWSCVNSFGPRACYDLGKCLAESLCFEHLNAGLDVRLCRIFNTYGPQMRHDDGRVVTNFIDQALNGRDITVYGDGTQTRSLCYVSDLVEGIARLSSIHENPRSPVNLGNPHELTMINLASEVRRLTNSDSKIVFKPLPIDDPRQRRPDISLANRLLNWEPRIDLEQGLKNVIYGN